jgi:hypothetical protein
VSAASGQQSDGGAHAEANDAPGAAVHRTGQRLLGGFKGLTDLVVGALVGGSEPRPRGTCLRKPRAPRAACRRRRRRDGEIWFGQLGELEDIGTFRLLGDGLVISRTSLSMAYARNDAWRKLYHGYGRAQLPSIAIECRYYSSGDVCRGGDFLLEDKGSSLADGERWGWRRNMNYARGRYYRTRYYWYIEVPGEGQFEVWGHLTPEFVCPVSGKGGYTSDQCLFKNHR